MKTGVLEKALTVLSGIAIAVAVWTHYQVVRRAALLDSHKIQDLNTVLNLFCLGVFIAVFGAMCYSIVAHRRSTGPKASHFYGSVAVELIWTAIPFAILMVAALPATKTVIDQNLADTIRIEGQKVASR